MRIKQVRLVVICTLKRRHSSQDSRLTSLVRSALSRSYRVFSGAAAIALRLVACAPVRPLAFGVAVVYALALPAALHLVPRRPALRALCDHDKGARDEAHVVGQRLRLGARDGIPNDRCLAGEKAHERGVIVTAEVERHREGVVRGAPVHGYGRGEERLAKERARLHNRLSVTRAAVVVVDAERAEPRPLQRVELLAHRRDAGNIVDGQDLGRLVGHRVGQVQEALDSFRIQDPTVLSDDALDGHVDDRQRLVVRVDEHAADALEIAHTHFCAVIHVRRHSHPVNVLHQLVEQLHTADERHGGVGVGGSGARWGIRNLGLQSGGLGLQNGVYSS